MDIDILFPSPSCGGSESHKCKLAGQSSHCTLHHTTRSPIETIGLSSQTFNRREEYMNLYFLGDCMAMAKSQLLQGPYTSRVKNERGGD